jgi:LPS export ABC transporter permease LptF/LPS export ABC transporter permease LptG
MRLIDRYVIREIIPPFFLALAVFTFIMAVNPMLDYAEDYLAKGVPLETVGFLLLNLLPQALGVTIPMALLTGVLMALGRMSADREPVALMACGLSPQRLLVPILTFAGVVALANFYTMVRLVPDSNQMFREVTFKHLIERTESDIKPGEFYEGFPNYILLVQDTKPGGRWSRVLLADATHQDRLTVTLAEEGRLQLDREKKEVRVTLTDVTRYVQGDDGQSYAMFPDEQGVLRISAAEVFGTGSLDRGLPEMPISELKRQIVLKQAKGESPHNEIMQIQQMFAFPVACLTFAVLGLALGLHTRQEGKFAGLALGIGVIIVYMGLHAQAEDWTKGGDFPAAWARWLPNLVLMPLGVLALWWRSRAVGRDITFSIPRLIGRFRRTRTGEAGKLAAAPAAKRVAVVIRLPAFTLPRPRLLDLYLLKRLVRLAALAFLALMLLNYIGTFLDESEYLFKGQASWRLLLAHLYFLTPQFTMLVFPAATLVAVLGTIGGLTRTGELTVMRACGVSLYRAALPLLAFAVLGSVLLFLVDDRVLDKANKQADAIRSEIRHTARAPVHFQRLNWLAGTDGTVYHYLGYDSAREQVVRPSILRTATQPFRLESHTTAADATFKNGVWMASNGWTQEFPSATATVRHAFTTPTVVKLPETKFFREARASDDAMTFNELRDYINRYEGRGFGLDQYRVDLHRKVAMPLATVVMALLAIPFGLTTGKRGALYGIGLAVSLAFGHQFISIIFNAAGQAAMLPAWLAAWAANILFLAGAVYMVFTVRT